MPPSIQTPTAGDTSPPRPRPRSILQAPQPAVSASVLLASQSRKLVARTWRRSRVRVRGLRTTERGPHRPHSRKKPNKPNSAELPWNQALTASRPTAQPPAAVCDQASQKYWPCQGRVQTFVAPISLMRSGAFCFVNRPILLWRTLLACRVDTHLDAWDPSSSKRRNKPNPAEPPWNQGTPGLDNAVPGTHAQLRPRRGVDRLAGKLNSNLIGPATAPVVNAA